MNKKPLVFTLLFVSVLILSVFVSSSVRDVWNCAEGLGKGHKIQCIEPDGWLWDDDKDGNVSLKLEFLNRYDYAIKNVTLNIEKCAGEIKIDIIKSGEYFWENESVLIKTDDVCVYDYYDWGENYFRSNSSFTYFDKDNIQKSYDGEFMFYVSGISQSEYEERIKKQGIESTGGNVGDSLSNEIMKHMLLRSFIIVAGSLIILLLIILLLGSKRFKKKQK